MSEIRERERDLSEGEKGDFREKEGGGETVKVYLEGGERCSVNLRQIMRNLKTNC